MFIQSFDSAKLDYCCIVYDSARPLYIQRLDTIHNQGLRLCFPPLGTPIMGSTTVGSCP